MKNYVLPFFAILAVAVGLLISYVPPEKNGAELWGLVSLFLGYLVRDFIEYMKASFSTQSPAAGAATGAPADSFPSIKE